MKAAALTHGMTYAAMRARVKRGQPIDNPPACMTRLTVADIADIKARHIRKESRKSIAERYGVSILTISKAINNKIKNPRREK
jgi:DNA invertase Pin-like site-specific DNA recombinase